VLKVNNKNQIVQLLSDIHAKAGAILFLFNDFSSLLIIYESEVGV